MKLTKSQLKSVLTILKPMETKDQVVTMGIENNVLNVSVKKEGMLLKLRSIKTEEETSPKISIKKEFLTRVEKQDAEEFDLKINKKTITSKINGVNFSTNIMDEDMNVDIEEEEVEATKVLLTPEIIDLLGKALFFIAKDTKRPALQGVNFVLKDKKLTIISTDTIKMFITHVKTDIEGEFNVILRQEMIPVLLAIHETIGKKAFPVLINEQGLYIISKGIYFKSVLLEGPFPDITKVVEKVENTKTTYELTFDEKTFKKIKSLENKSSTLVIKKTGKEILFEMKSEIDLNSFKLEAEDDVEFEKKMNYTAFTSVLGMVPKVEFKGDFLIFKQNDTIILLMAMRN